MDFIYFSKLYRKNHRKTKEGEKDSEYLRIKERADLAHSTNEWSKRLGRTKGLDDTYNVLFSIDYSFSAKASLAEQRRLENRLKQKMGTLSNDTDSEEQELKDMEMEMSSSDDEKAPKKGLMSLKFMVRGVCLTNGFTAYS